MTALLAPRLWRMVILPAVAFSVLAATTEDRAFILVLNIVQFGLAIAVVTAFSPEVWRILVRQRPMTRGSWMAYGIWVGWGAVVWRTAESLIWRFLGQPPWLVNSDVTSAYLYMGCVGALAHIVRPGELDERIPAPEQIRIGLIIGTLAAIGLGFVYAPEIMALLHGGPMRGDLPAHIVG